MEKACVHIYCGNGKGKTTASIGLLTRASGANKKCLLAQFLKEIPTSETVSLEKLGVKTLRAQSNIKKFVFAMDESEKALYTAEQQKLFEQVCLAVQSHEYDLIVLDEVLDAISLGIIPEESLASLLQQKGDTEMVVTGRAPGESIAALADYYSKIEPIKHPYSQGLHARKGVEF